MRPAQCHGAMQVLSRPYLFIIPFLVPAQYRIQAGILFFFVLTSGIFI